MDELNLQPDTLNTADTTHEIEGYEDHVEEIEQAYPEEDWRTPAEQEAEREAQAEQPTTPTAEEGEVQPEVQEEPEVQPEPVEAEPVEPHYQLLEDGTIDIDSFTDRDGKRLTETETGRNVAQAIKLKHTWLADQEGKLKELFKDGWNLEAQAEAFVMIRNTPELVDRYDHNNDGEITYDDFFDTTNMAEWDEDLGRLNPEVDARLTQEWIEGLQSKDAGSRLRAIWQQNGAGQNMARFVNLRRQHALAPQDSVDAGEDWRQHISGGIFNASSQALGAIGSVGQAINGENPLTNSTFDDDILQHKNPQSLEFLVNNEIARLDTSKMAGHMGYWPTAGFFVWATASAGAAGASAVGIKGASAATAKAFATPSLKSFTAAGLKSFAGQTARFVAVDTLPAAAFANLQEDGWGMMYESGGMEAVAKLYPETAVFGPQIAQGIESPLFKQADFMLGEYTQNFIGMTGIGALGRGITKSAPRAFTEMVEKGGRWAQKNMDQMAVSTKSFSTSLEAPLADQSRWLSKKTQQAADLAEAAGVQMNKAADGARNAFVKADTDGLLHSTYGAYKNGKALVGQGWTKARSGVRQALNDIDEIRHTIGLQRKGSTDSLFSQTDMAKAAKRGVSDGQLDLFAKELVDDAGWKAQLKKINPIKRATRREVSESAELGIREVMGRDAAGMTPDEFWGKELMDSPLETSFEKMSDWDKWAVKNMEVADTVNQSLLLQLRDNAMTAGDMIGKTDIFAIDGAISRIADNLAVGLSHVKKTQYNWSLARKLLEENNGKMTPDLMVDLLAESSKASKRIHRETHEGINLMTRMMMEDGNDDLAAAVLDVFKVSNDVHNWKDFDAWMHQKLVGGDFKGGKVQTGDLVHGLQQVMVQSILSGPKTPVRAIMGTGMNSYLNAFNEALGATLRRPFTGDVASYKASTAKLKGMLDLIPEAMQVFRREWNSKFDANIADIRTRYSEAPTSNDKLFNATMEWAETRGTDGEKAAAYIHNTTRQLTNNKLFGWSPRALAATDDTFKWLMARARSKELAMREALEAFGDDFTQITPDILKQAEDIHYNRLLDGEGNINLANDSWFSKQFKEVTLTSELKGQAAKLDDAFNSIPQMKPFYLFARTGLNGLNLSFKNTPLLSALHKESIDILKHTGDDFAELHKYGITNANELASARNLFAGRQALGASVVTAMSGMYLGSQLTGNGPADRQLRQQWINAGWKPNHIYIGDVGFDYRSLEPYNVIFSSIADIGDNMELMGSEWAEKRLQAVAFVIGRGLTGKTYMSGLDQMMQVMQMKPGAMNKTAANILNNSIPLAGMRNEFGKWTNPHLKELNSDMWTSIRNRNQATEFLAGGGKLPEKSDLLNGKPINNWNFIGRSFNAVSPVSLDIRNDTPGRRLLLDSNYDLKSTTYAYGGYSFVKDAHVRAHFQNAIGTVPITVGFKKFKNVEEALNYLATRKDIKNSMKDMKKDGKNPANWDLDPNTYPHNTLIDNVMNQARSKAWAKLNNPSHPGYEKVQQLKAEKDGKDSKTRDNRQEILDLSFPDRSVEQFPKN